MTVRPSLDDYRQALARWLASSTSEQELQTAYEIGRKLVQSGAGLVDLTAVHSHAVADMLPSGDADPGAVLRSANEFLTEGLSPFEMALRGYQQSNATLRLLNETLERRVDERTQEVEAERVRFQHVLESTPAVIYSMRLSEPIEMLYLSPRVEELTGCPPEQWSQERGLSSIHPDDRERFLGALSRCRHDRKPLFVEYRIVGAGGRLLWVRDQARVISGIGPPVIHGLIIDITAERTLQDQLAATQRMESVGRLAGGVAHDFNNMLSVIRSCAELLIERFDAGDPAHELVSDIVHAADRSAALTSQLLAFGRRQLQRLQVIDLDEVVESVQKMLRRIIGEDIHLAVHHGTGSHRVMADQSQIEQILVNLAINARDAMPGGGRLTIETGHQRVDEAYVQEHPGVAPGEYVVLAVSDSGTGMDAATRARIFEPFFTTKDQGRGTGLGLATTYGIVKQSGGSIWVYSEKGIGTSFKIHLPRVEHATNAAPAAERTGTSKGGTETILVVEDEKSVRGIVVRLLQRAGYVVLEAATGDEALAAVAGHAGPVDLLLTDIVMPGMRGSQLAQEIRRLRPHIHVLYTSGYADDAIVEHGVLDRDVDYLEKPFSIATLLRRVREALDRERTSPAAADR